MKTSHLFWIRAMTCEYVFPRTVSPFTFTSLSPASAQRQMYINKQIIIIIIIRYPYDFMVIWICSRFLPTVVISCSMSPPAALEAQLFLSFSN